MSTAVLQRDIDAYQRAVDQYQRQVKGYNNQAQAFNDSFYRDANGAQAGVVSGNWTQNMPGDRTGYALYTDPTNAANQFLRRPTGAQDAGAAELQNLGRGNVRVYLPGGGDFVTGWNKQDQLQNELMKRGFVAPGSFDFNSLTNGRQNLGLQRANFTDAPVAPDAFNRRAPEATIAQTKQMGLPTMVQNEAGLIGEVLQGGGLKPGVQVRRANPGATGNTPAPAAQGNGTATTSTVATQPAPPIETPWVVAREGGSTVATQPAPPIETPWVVAREGGSNATQPAPAIQTPWVTRVDRGS